MSTTTFICSSCQFPISGASNLDLFKNIENHTNNCKGKLQTKSTKPSSSSATKTTPTTYKCPLCLEDGLSADEIFYTNCPKNHMVCIECLERMASLDLKEKRVICCPLKPCTQEPSAENPNQLHRLDYLPLTIYVKPKISKQEWENYLEFLTIVETSLNPNFCKCPNASCKNGVLAPSEPSERNNHRVYCDGCKIEFCSFCSEKYHYKVDCKEARRVRDLWIQYNLNGRSTAQKKSDELRKRWQEQMKNLEQDEIYKEQHCRICPHCNRVVEKMSGCDSMKCGTDYHGGNLQSGCQQVFHWNSAKKYQKQLTPPCPAPNRSTNTVHSMYNCSSCNKEIVGIRFSCIHCIGVDYCEACEEAQTARHNPSHSFRLITTPTDN